jgi:molybdopterin molybdotransferase
VGVAQAFNKGNNNITKLKTERPPPRPSPQGGGRSVLIPVEEALAKILDTAKLMPVELVPLAKCYGRILATDVVAKRDQPPFPSSAMDGYAIRFDDQSSPLKLVGVAAAGHAFKRDMEMGEAVRILTGAPLPKGADTIVIQENVRVEDGRIHMTEPATRGRNIRPLGLDFTKGDVLVPAGVKLNARDIGLCAAANVPMLRVRRKPRLVLFTTGDELVLPGQKPRVDQIVSSNSHAIAAMAEAWGGDVINLGIVRDTLKATMAAIKKAGVADILITTGGASVGDHDYVQEALKKSGIKIGFWKIALRPGKPLMFGTKGKLRVLGLPGNPVSALVCARIFLKPLIDAMQGVSATQQTITALLGNALPANDGRQDYIRASLSEAADGHRIATAFGKQDSSMQRTLRNADCLIIRAPHAPEAPIGTAISVLLLDF